MVSFDINVGVKMWVCLMCALTYKQFLKQMLKKKIKWLRINLLYTFTVQGWQERSILKLSHLTR